MVFVVRSYGFSIVKCSKDPYCMENLSDKPEFATLKEALWNELQTKLKETNDPRIFNQGEVFDRYEYIGGDEHSWANYVNGTWQKQCY